MCEAFNFHYYFIVNISDLMNINDMQIMQMISMSQSKVKWLNQENFKILNCPTKPKQSLYSFIKSKSWLFKDNFKIF